MASGNIMNRQRATKKRARSSPTFFLSPLSNVFIIILLTIWSKPGVRQHHRVNGFVGSQTLYKTGGPIIYRSQCTRFATSPNKNGQDGRNRSGSRLQVRRRVKAVLEKARIRTGVKNGSVLSPSRSLRPAPTVVAEASASGGPGDGLADIVFTQIDQQTSSASSTNGEMKSINGAQNRTQNENATPKNLNGARKPSNNINIITFPDEELELVEKNGAKKNELQNETAKNRNSSQEITVPTSRKPEEFELIKSALPTVTAFIEPLPFKLPKFTDAQRTKLVNGERIQEQSRMGREGSGYVVLDIEAPPYVIWECLLNFESYPELIPTVREMQLYTSTKLNTGFVNEKPLLPGTGRETRHYGTPSITRASFILSKFRLNIAAIHKYTPHPDGDYMTFTLDPSCTNVVLKGAKGTWHTEENPDGRKGFTRVYLLASLQISRALPKFIVDYAAERAMPRATNWLKPEVEALKESWLNDVIE